MKKNKVMWLLLLLVALLAACGGGPRPSELVRADRLFANKVDALKAKKAAPKIYQVARRYYQMAEEAFDDGDDVECLHYSLMAAISYSTALENARRLEAEQRQVEAEKRLAAARQLISQQQARQADAERRIKRMEQILALKQKLEQEKVKSQKEKARIAAEVERARQEAEAAKKAAAERLAAEQAKAEQLKREKEVGEILARARSQMQMAESLDAAKYDSMNMSSARTYLKQSQQALVEKRFDNARDLAKLAVEKAGLAIKAAQAAYAKKTAEAQRLKERENLFKEANSIDGAEAKTDTRGVVITLREMFAPAKAEVLPERTYLLDKIAELARKYQGYPLIIEGYTDSRGRETANLALSQSRAQAVSDYLIQQQKLDMNRIKASGYGEARPIADNSRSEGRAKNRRIEVIFLFR